MTRVNASIFLAAIVAGGLMSSSPLTAAAPARLYMTFVSHSTTAN